MSSYLQRLIAQGEGEQLDFKHSISDSYKIAKSIVSFANKSGGSLLVGVDDKARIVGVNEKEEAYMLDLAIKNYCRPSINSSFKKHKTKAGKVVIECIILSGENPPYAAKEKGGKWVSFIRDGDECRKLSTVRYEMLKQLNNVDLNIAFSKHEEKVVNLLKLEPEGLLKNEVIKKLGIDYRLGVSVLANLLRLEVLDEIYFLNKWRYRLK
jgi:predicted HTH transcriptional regulator